METRIVEYIDSDYDVAFTLRQATMAQGFVYEGWQQRMLAKYPLTDMLQGNAMDAPEQLSMRWHMQHSLPAIKAVLVSVENRDEDKEPFPEIDENTFADLPYAAIQELVEGVYALNPHWSPFFARTKATRNGSTKSSSSGSEEKPTTTHNDTTPKKETTDTTGS